MSEAVLESLKERIALLEKQVAERTPDAPDKNFNPGVLDSKKLATDVQSGGLYVPRHPENPYPVGREPDQQVNPMVMVPGKLSQLPAVQQLMRACCNNPSAFANHLEEIPVSYVTVSCLYDVLMLVQSYLDVRDDPEVDGEVGAVPEIVEVDRFEMLAAFNTLNAVLCLNVPLLQEKFLYAEKNDPATRKERVTELGVQLKVLRDQRLRRVAPSLQVDTLSQEASSRLEESMVSKQITTIAKMLAESLPLYERGESSGGGKSGSGLTSKDMKELQQFRRQAAKQRQSNKKGGKGEDG